MVVITGAAGFIASNLAARLQAHDLLLVDDFSDGRKLSNHEHLRGEKMQREVFLDWFVENSNEVKFVFHLGARTDTSEFNFRILDSLNTAYSKAVWEICARKNIPVVYASSAATYGIGELGFDDDEEKIPVLKPLNPYGLSKQLFDMYVLAGKERPPFWAGLKFFNVYGPHETHKHRMASVIFHAFQQIKNSGTLKLFQSHRSDFENGGQLRDFIYVDDIVEICLHFFENAFSNGSEILSGIYNCGTGKARSFNDLAKSVFHEMGREELIEYIPTPEDIRDKYQYFTEAKIDKLRKAKYEKPFLSLEEGVKSYIAYLLKEEGHG